jgi:chaperonin cofactor prefoldin
MFPNEMSPGHMMTPGRWRVVEEEYAARNPTTIPAKEVPQVNPDVVLLVVQVDSLENRVGALESRFSVLTDHIYRNSTVVNTKLKEVPVVDPEPDKVAIRFNLLESRLTALTDQMYSNRQDMLAMQNALNDKLDAHTIELGNCVPQEVMENRFQAAKKIADTRNLISNSEIDQLRADLADLVIEVRDLRK